MAGEEKQELTEEQIYHKALGVLSEALDDKDVKVRLAAVKIALKGVPDDIPADDGEVLFHLRAAERYARGLKHGHKAGVGEEGEE